MSWPTRCADVEWAVLGVGFGESEHCRPLGAGDLLWNPKMGEGHLIVGAVDCGLDGADCGCGGWAGPCTEPTMVCECGKSGAYRDHHYFVLARK